MKTLTFDNREEWLHGRLGRITGTRAQSVCNIAGLTKEMIVAELETQKAVFKKTDKKEDLAKLLSFDSLIRLYTNLPNKIGFYAVIAELLGVPADDENTMERGSRLESEALDRFAEETGKEVDKSLAIWVRDDEESIAISPDGVVKGEPAAVECKCLSAARHVQAYLTRAIPDEYEYQYLQYFVTNDELEKLYFVFYDPRFTMFAPGGSIRKEGKSKLDFFYLEVRREDVQERVAELLAYQKEKMREIREIVTKLSF